MKHVFTTVAAAAVLVASAPALATIAPAAPPGQLSPPTLTSPESSPEAAPGIVPDTSPGTGAERRPDIPLADAPPVPWDECAFADGAFSPELKCAMYTVPLDHANPEDGTTRLAMALRPADDPERRKGTLFVNPGGPGSSGFIYVTRGVADAFLDPEVLASYDIVGFDPRGIVGSTPLRCFDGTEDPELFSVPEVWPDSGSDRLDRKQTGDRLARQCDRKGGEIADHMSTTAVADDLDILRRAVGDTELNLIGYSYGSYLGAVYANRYPDTVGAMVLDGALDPVTWATGRNDEGDRIPLSARIGSDASAQATLNEFFRLCEEAGPDGCAFAPNTEQRFTALLTELEERPLLLATFFPENDQTVVSNTLGLMYDSFGWEFLAGNLAALEALAANRDNGTVRLSPQQRAGYGREVLDNWYYGNEGFYGVTCSDATNPEQFQRWDIAARDSVGVFGPLWNYSDSYCASWRGEDVDRYIGPFNAETSSTILIASTRYDPATPYDGALALHEELPNSALLTVEGWGHTTPLLSVCADDIVTQYLLTKEVPAEEMTCEQDFAPFATPVFASQDAGAVVVDAEELSESLAGDTAAEETADALETQGRSEQAERVRARSLLTEQLTVPGLRG